MSRAQIAPSLLPAVIIKFTYYSNMQENYWKIEEDLWFETCGGIEDNACGECEDGCAGTTPPRVVVRHHL